MMKKKEDKKPIKKKAAGAKKPKKKPAKRKPQKPRKLFAYELAVCHARIKNPTWPNYRCYRAGYPNCNINSSYSLAHEFFKKPHISKYIDEFTEKMIREVEIDVQYILRSLMNIREFNPQCLVDDDGNPVPLEKLDPEDAKILESIKFDYLKYKDDEGKEKFKATISRFKTPSQTAALDLLGKYLKMWSDKAELILPDDLPNRKFEITFVSPGPAPAEKEDDKK